MALGLATTMIVLIALLSVLALPRLQRSVIPVLHTVLARAGRDSMPALADDLDPGRELRAEQRARALLRSCVNEEEWAMYRELGFLRVWGTLSRRPGDGRPHGRQLRWIAAHISPSKRLTAVPYAYLIYPHKPILAYLPHTGVVLGEYCVEFPDLTRPYGSSRLPAADDVLAKWVALSTEEHDLIEQANMHLPGRQIGLAETRRDLARLSCWERERLQCQGRSLRLADSVPA